MNLARSALDHELVQKSEENFILVRNGCVCCTVRGDLVSTLQDLTDRQRLRDIGTLDRVVIETTGLADPAPILHTLMNDRSLLNDYGLGAVVATIDAVNGLDTLDQHQEAVKQIGIADLLLLTKTDLASPEKVSALRDRIAAINPGAKIVRTIGGNIDPADFFASGLYRLEGKTADVQNWLRAEAYDDVVRAHAITANTTAPTSGVPTAMMIESMPTASRESGQFHGRISLGGSIS